MLERYDLIKTGSTCSMSCPDVPSRKSSNWPRYSGDKAVKQPMNSIAG